MTYDGGESLKEESRAAVAGTLRCRSARDWMSRKYGAA
jgi:hypothetical protein